MTYMGDVMLLDTFEQYLERLRITAQRMADMGIIQLTPERCNQLRLMYSCSGLLLRRWKQMKEREKLAWSMLFPATKLTNLRRLQGMLRFYRQFIPNCEDLSRPLNESCFAKEHDCAEDHENGMPFRNWKEQCWTLYYWNCSTWIALSVVARMIRAAIILTPFLCKKSMMYCISFCLLATCWHQRSAARQSLIISTLKVADMYLLCGKKNKTA